MPRSKNVDQDQLDDQPISDEAEPAPTEPAQEHRGYIPGVADPAAGMLLVGHVTIQD